jgi:menaquinone-dependent protoporphyrinogen oxidase
MPAPVLIAYATKHGSTQEVAEAIAKTLDSRGFEVHVMPAREVRDVEPYRAVVVGGALYMGRWHRDALRLLRRHADALERRPLAFFAMGPKSVEAAEIETARRELEHSLGSVQHLSPVAITVFGGVIDPGELHFPFNRMAAVDARDWQAIETWAHELATRFAAPSVPVPVM